MASKMRISVNFSSKQLYNLILNESKKTGVSSSSIIQSMLLDSIRQRIDDKNKNILPENLIRENRNLNPKSTYMAGLEINLLSIKNGMKSNNASGHSIQESTFDFNIQSILAYGVKNTSTYIRQEDVINKVSININNKAHSFFNKDFNPDLLLVFVFNINVFCTGYDDKNINVKVKYSYRLIPVYLNKTNTSEILKLDLMNIKYRRYSDVAKNGWDRMKYSHLLNVRDIKNYKGGGYFVGLLYEPQTCEEILDQATDFVWQSGNKYKIFTNPLTVKIKNHTFPKSVTLNEDGHIVINENKPDNGRLVEEALKKIEW